MTFGVILRRSPSGPEGRSHTGAGACLRVSGRCDQPGLCNFVQMAGDAIGLMGALQLIIPMFSE
jgi:hypothetical protein